MPAKNRSRRTCLSAISIICRRCPSAAEVEAAMRRFKKALIERALGAELSHHLGYAPGGAKPKTTTNHRNGMSGKTVLTDDGPLRSRCPRDREGTFEPLLIPQARAPLHRALTTRSSRCTPAA